METENINYYIKKLDNEFKIIKNKGFIKGFNQNNKGDAGLTFENLIGKENDSFQISDYHGIEIKVKTYYGKRYISLFTLVPSNNFGMGLKDLRRKYGTADDQFKNCNIFIKSIYGNKMVQINKSFKAKIKVAYDLKKIFLEIYNRKNKLIDNYLYWDFEDLERVLNRKMNYLALIFCNKKVILNKNYYKYEKISFYKLSDFNNFLKLIENGTIRIYFCLGTYKSGYKMGKEHDHGISFGIKEIELIKLYNKF